MKYLAVLVLVALVGCSFAAKDVAALKEAHEQKVVDLFDAKIEALMAKLGEKTGSRPELESYLQGLKESLHKVRELIEAGQPEAARELQHQIRREQLDKFVKEVVAARKH